MSHRMPVFVLSFLLLSSTVFAQSYTARKCELPEQDKVPVWAYLFDDYPTTYESPNLWVEYYVDLSQLPWSEGNSAVVKMFADEVRVKVDKNIGGTALSFKPLSCYQYSSGEVTISPDLFYDVTLWVENKEQKETWQKSLKKLVAERRALYEQRKKQRYQTVLPPAEK